MTATEIAAAIATKQAEIAELIKQLLALGSTTATPTTPSTTPDAQAGNILTVKASTGKTTTTTGTARLAVGTTVTFKNGRTTVITATDDGVTVTTREPSADTPATIAALAGTSLTVNALPKSSAGSSGSAPVAETPTTPTPVEETPATTVPSSVELVTKLQIKAKGSLKSLAKAVIGVNNGQSGGGVKLRQANMDCAFATETDIKLLASKGVTRVRISLRWPRVVRTLDGEIDATYGAQLLAVLKLYGKYGITVLVCGAHDYGAYAFGAQTDIDSVPLGNARVPQGSLAKMWAKLSKFISADKEARAALYGYDLMNEPINLADPLVIVREYQLCIDAIRATDKTCAIAVEPYPWATTREFMVYGPVLFTLKDPSNLIEIHTHCYFDTDAGGDYVEDDSSIDPIKAIGRMKAVIAACKAAGFKHAFGEMGAPASKRVGNANVPTPNAAAALANGIAYALANGSDVYLWWWSEYQANDWDNINSITAPRNSDVMAVLQQWL